MTTREEAQRLADALDAISAYSDAECSTLSEAAALLRQWPEAGWMPIESAPRDGTALLVMRDIWPGKESGKAEECNGHNTYVTQWWQGERDGSGAWICYMGAVQDPECPIDPTHWMPLPAAPGAAPSQQPAPERNEWREAVLDQLVAHALDAPQDEPPAVILRRVISMAVTIAIDPAVSSDAQALIDRGAAQQPAPARPDEFVCPHCFDEGAAPQAAQSGKVLGYVSKTGHGTYFRETITPALAELEHGGRKMWTPLVAAPQAVPQPLTREQHIALCEAQQWAREQSYFDARPQIDDNQSRRVFGAAFKAGYEAGYETLTRGITAKGNGNG